MISSSLTLAQVLARAPQQREKRKRDGSTQSTHHQSLQNHSIVCRMPIEAEGISDAVDEAPASHEVKEERVMEWEPAVAMQIAPPFETDEHLTSLLALIEMVGENRSSISALALT
ncbi:hypothetical protein BLNAU_20364 [Blattamonas nauphoetae]|uniref:Uncharacterized protein n=1 Tax=Blattamonas nauphoetae TaxID=2049346 RepID=A0ABQ9WZI4_9EUKA|nr:hypothetical protein BLNAU_20364 [Blattamonas nauphoetae]